MTTSWALTAQEICEDAFGHLGMIDAGDMPGASEMQWMLRGLDAVLKELPLAGYTWPKLSSETALPWTGVQNLVMPTDYFGQPVAWRTDNGRRVPLKQIPHGEWVEMTNRTAAGTPTQFYISPDNVFYVFPTPTADPGIYLQYQRIIDDVAAASAPNVPQYALNALGYGAAHETSLKFAKDNPRLRAEIEARWLEKRARIVAYSVPNDLSRLTVDD